MPRSRKRPGAIPGAGHHSKGLFSRNTKGKAEKDEEKANGAEEVLSVGWARSEQEFVGPVLVQRQVHHFGRRHPGGLRGNSSPELCLVCAVQLLHRRVLPGGQALDHAAARMCTPAGEDADPKTQAVKRAAKLFSSQL